MLKDSHVHTTLSHDGKSSMVDYIDIADTKDVDEITFTEHYDIYDDTQRQLETLDVQNYYETFQRIKDNTRFKINFGIEIGLQPDIKEKISNVTQNYPFDFVIGSSHTICKKDIRDSDFFDGCTRRLAYLKYFKEVLENIKLYDKEFDVYGHLDYIVRYGNYLEKRINYEEFKDILDEILITLINKDKGIEVNTSGLRHGFYCPHPNIDILKRYKELGGKIITIGSDAHNVKDLASDFDVAYDILDSVGFEEIAIYRNRIPEFIKY